MNDKKRPIENEENLVSLLEDFTGPDEPNGPASAQIYHSNEVEDGIRPRMTIGDLCRRGIFPLSRQKYGRRRRYARRRKLNHIKFNLSHFI